MTIETSTSIENLAAALGKFQAETHGVVRDATNPFLKNRYATLEAVIETARPALAKAGLAFLQAPGDISNGLLELTTMLMHGSSGEWIRSTTRMPLNKMEPQAVGSATTYGLRYSLMAMLGLPPLDDDAEATKQQPPAERSSPPTPRSGPPHKVITQATASAFIPTWEEQIPPDLGYNPRASVVSTRPSKQVYVENALKRMADMDTGSKLLIWAKNERKMVWPQYGIEPHDEDGQKLVKAYKERMAQLEKTDETEPAE